jgi:hypothetical protein
MGSDIRQDPRTGLVNLCPSGNGYAPAGQSPHQISSVKVLFLKINRIKVGSTIKSSGKAMINPPMTAIAKG